MTPGSNVKADTSHILRLRLFGPFSAELNGCRLKEERRSDRLLAFLTLQHGRALSGDFIADTLWPEGIAPGDSLKKCQSSLREALKGEEWRLSSAKGAVRIDLAGADVDLIEFDSALTSHNIEGLRRAVSLYTGLLLQGWEEPWVVGERRARHEKAIATLRTLAERSLNSGENEPAADYLRRFLRFKPASEWAYTSLAEALSRAGERLEALEVCRKYSEYVSKKGLEPSARIVKIMEAIQAPAVSAPSDQTGDAGEYEPVGGAVPLRSAYYIARPTDAEVHAAVARRDSTVLLKGARQMGKTSLLARALQQARQVGARVALTELQMLSSADLQSPKDCFLALARSLEDQIEVQSTAVGQWDDSRGPAANFERYLRRSVLPQSQPPLVWALDEVDHLFPCSFRNDVLGAFRNWHNGRAMDSNGPWTRLTLALAYSTEAHLFITDLNQSPFNVCAPIELRDFTAEQVMALNSLYGSPLEARSAIPRLISLLSGHPYLTQRALREVARNGVTIADLEQETNAIGPVFGGHLERMFTPIAQNPEIAEGLRSILSGGGCSEEVFLP
ncbi:MAG TPA: AAA-like domain-containing protein, partial [Chthonomonadales bacterium]|nr:AAA-like domain-containing protein [Chthonomonadales bacterium]